MFAHFAGALARPAPSKPFVKYVKGLQRYTNVQKPGRKLGDASIPQKSSIRNPKTLARLAAVSAEVIPVIIRTEKVLTWFIHVMTNKKAKVARESVVPVAEVLL